MHLVALLSVPVVSDFAGVQRNFEALARLIHVGRGDPEGEVPAKTGSLFINEDGGAGVTLYVKEDSPTMTTGWEAK